MRQPNHRKPNLDEAIDIIERYEKGESLVSLASVFNLSTYVVKKLLVDNKIYLRDRKESSACRDHSNDAEPEYMPSPEEIAEQKVLLRGKHLGKRYSETTHGYERPTPGIRCCSAAPIKQL